MINSGSDTLIGGVGSDALFGQYRDDIIDGGLGDDYVEGGEGNDTINGGGGDDSLYGDDQEGNPDISGNDTIYGEGGNDEIYGGRGNDTLSGDAGRDILVGEQGNDTLDGGNGNDQLTGTDIAFFGQLQQGFGFGEIDTLIGGKGNDTFVLGLEKANARGADGSNTVIRDIVLYNDGNPNANGTRDYALIKDFGLINNSLDRGVDKIQLAGSQSLYSLGASPVSERPGTGIFFHQNQYVGELIGIVEGISPTNLSLSNTSQFIFV